MSTETEKRALSSELLFAEAQKVIPGGVNSPVRAFKGVGGTPVFISRGEGARVWDTEGKVYIDYLGSWGPLILGHAHPAVVEAITLAASQGTTFGAATEREVRMARKITEAVPSMEKVRLVSSGTEATMTALRLARAHTGRSRFVKFEGCYHGHADPFLVKAGSGLLTQGISDSAGVPASVAELTIPLPYNDLDGVKEAFRKYPNEIAAVFVEPVAANMGVVPPNDGFLSGLREITKTHDALLIFDEVITGFRVGYGGAQSLFNIVPDLTCLGKIIGGGLPVGAVGGRADIMNRLAPLGDVYQAGTLSGNPLAVAAGLRTLEVLQAENPYPRLEKEADFLCTQLTAAARKSGIPVACNRAASMWTLFFTAGVAVRSYRDVQQADRTGYSRFFHGMLKQGIYLAPSAFEAAFLSTAHTHADTELTIKAATKVFEELCAS
ncbi:MAG: glutamate-1-semialdehyde 2,1-aminomutase [Armatimonadetes bacterium]|nr:glutamate-1-semialdehyde 2,1-aminomutase [Armatimonadota bacterium]